MSQLLAVGRFELKKRLKMLSTWIYFLTLAAAGAFILLGSAGAFSGVSVGFGAEKVHANAPQALQDLIMVVGDFGLIITAGIFGQSIHEDVEHHFDSILFTTPMTKLAYLGGRFCGALVTSLIVFLGIGVGAFVAAHMPFLESQFLGPDRLAAYFWPYITSAGPNVLMCGALFFALAALTRRMMPVYTAAIVLVIGYLLAGSLIHDIDNKMLAALLDPFATGTISYVREYWTTAENNTRLLPITGIYVANRAIWLGLALLLSVFAYRRFKMAHVGTADTTGAAATAGVQTTSIVATPTPDRGTLSVLAALTWLSFKETIKNTYFLVILLAGVIFTFVNAFQAGKIFGTPTWPVTYEMIEVTGGTFTLFVLIIVIFVAGELVWRERDAQMNQIFDALPLLTWSPLLTKLAALILATAVISLTVIVCGVAVQTVRGYHHYELGLYFEQIALNVLFYSLYCALTVSVQVMINQKYLAHFVVIVIYVATIFLGTWGTLPNVAMLFAEPYYIYSDMNGFGHFLAPVVAFRLYWLAFCAVLMVVSALFWVRGTNTGFRARWAEARRRLQRSGTRAALMVSIAAFAGLAAFLIVNTLVLNRYETGKNQERKAADYEKQYKKTERDPQPRVTAVQIAVDIFPERQEIEARGTYTLVNETEGPIASVTVLLPTEGHPNIKKLAVGAATTATTTDARLGVFTFALPTPLQPGVAVPLEFDIDFARKGFPNGMGETMVVDNGTFFTSGALPHIGYLADREIDEDNVRKKYDLPAKDKLPDPTSPDALKNNYFSSDADWVSFDAVISTSADQLAVAPGTLIKEWTENGRRNFHYRMDTPILHFFSVLSARYAVRKDHWNEVALEVDYNPGHEYNVDRMLEGIKDALTYCTAHYGPYQHKQVRILEFPRYASFAQSFPNTIPYSESIGFIARFDAADVDAVDYPYYVTAHEVAHQWWAHQVVGARAQGETLLSETLAEYTSLMVMKQKYGPDRMRRFLKMEADGYLRGRTFEQKREVPLNRVEDQAYIHYNKGGHVMYALQDAIGEDTLDRALASFLEKHRGKGPPYPTGLELVEEIKAVTPADELPLVKDLFETITLYDNHTESATCVKTPDGRFAITMKVQVKKLRAGELGEEKEVPLDRPVEVGALDDKGVPIALEKRTLSAGSSDVTLTVDRAPAKVGVDPLVKLLDREPDDNVVSVSCPKE